MLIGYSQIIYCFGITGFTFYASIYISVRPALGKF
jgi:hypothetical protein